MKTYLRLISYAKPYRKFLLPFIAFTLLAVSFNVFQFTLLIPLLNFLFDPIDPAEARRYLLEPEFTLTLGYFKEIFYYKIYYYKTYKPVNALYLIASIIVSAVVLTNLFRYLAQRTMLKGRTLLVKRLREAIFDKINHLHLGYFTKEHKGDLLSRMNADVLEIESVAANSFEILLKEPYLLIGYFVALFSISVNLTVFTLIIIPVSATGIALITKRLKKEAAATQASLGKMLTIIDETLSGMRIIRSFNATEFIKNKFRKENDLYRKASLEGFAKRELAPAFSEASGILVVSAILIYGGSLIINREYTQGGLQASEFITFIAIFSQVIRPAKAMVVAIANAQRGLASGERILEVIDTKNEIEDHPDAKDLISFTKEICFDKVSFRYNEHEVLHEISFSLQKGTTVALIGPSGVGKSTIADLLPRFYDVKKGSIRIDGHDIRQLKMESLRSHMSFVTQDTILFNDTVFNNIALGKPYAKEEDVIRAAKIANAHEFIVQMENGYHTIIGDRGLRLSGGQRQRLSIARAVFKDPEILILDEATSALDTESEKQVQEALNTLMKGRTTLVIAHRLSTIKEADLILVLENGRIKEQGSHKELVNREEGTYKRLTALQSF